VKPVSWAAVGFGILFGVQLVPYEREHTNPPVASGPRWDSNATRTLFFRVCRDCHSNETVWPWYSNFAPASWLVQHDVDEGRSHLNVSEWGRAEQHGDEAADMVRTGQMPPWFYTPLHPGARLSPTELDDLIAGLEATFGTDKDEHDHDGHNH